MSETAALRKLTAEDIEFLIDLRDELNTQDTVCQADPRFWVVLTHENETCWEGNAEWFDIVRDSDGQCIGRAPYEDETQGLSFVPMRERERIAENTMFLTLRECKEHIKANHYHYKDPISYAMTAWRSPQVEKLWKILQEVDWGRLK